MDVLTAAIGGLAGLAALGGLVEEIARRRERDLALPGRLVDVGGYRLHLTDHGEGGPAVVIIAGAGESSYSWMTVRARVAAFTRVVTYDRPGLGASDPGPPPSAEGSVQELRRLLAAAGVPGPYVLVGHSLGGLLARLYAVQHPDEVVGLVFVDSTHEQLVDDVAFRRGFAVVRALLHGMRVASRFGLPRLLATLGVMPMYPERQHYAAQLTPAQYAQWVAVAHRNVRGPAPAAESAAVAGLLAEAARVLASGPTPQLGDTPIVVLTNPGFGEPWLEMHRELARRSTNSVHHVSDRDGHSLQMPRPELVVDAIRRVVDEARRSADRAAAPAARGHDPEATPGRPRAP